MRRSTTKHPLMKGPREVMKNGSSNMKPADFTDFAKDNKVKRLNGKPINASKLGPHSNY